MSRRPFARLLCGLVLIGALLAPTATSLAEGVDHTGHKLVRVYLESTDQIQKLHDLHALLLSEAQGIGPVYYVIPPESMPALDALGIRYTVLQDDVQKLIDQERERLASQGPVDPRSRGWFDDYKNLDAVNAKMNAMAADRPDLASVFDIGVTQQSRHIYGIRITGPGSNKPAVLFNGCHHAREWISVMVPMWIADRLVYQYDTDPSIQSIVNRVEFFIIPVVNLDGYVYTWTTYRLWRKNRRPPLFGTCYGVDDNRNYATGWGGEGASGDPCDEEYYGPAAFSEPETAAMRDFAIAHPQIVASQSYHSFAQLFMSPYGYTSTLPADNPAFLEVDTACAQAILAVHGVSYASGPIYTTIYPASGNDVDWYYAHEGIFSFTTELRDTGMYGFELPPDQIIPTCEENFAAAMYLAEWSANPVKFSFPAGQPARLDPNTSTNLTVKITAVGGVVNPTSPRLYTRVGDSGPFTQYTLSGGLNDIYTATLPPTPCGRTLEYYLSAATTTGIVGYSPGDAPDSQYSVTAVPIVVLMDQNMSTNPGWTTTGQWAWGHPTGGGTHNHDPNNAYTGTNVYGYNLSGDYANNIPAYYLTTPAINCSGKYGVKLDFYRWLGVESNSDYDKATIEATNNGTTWTIIWRAADTGAAVADTSWQHVTYDISSVADNKPSVRIRWGMGPSDSYTTYPGWNIDDVKVWAPVAVPCLGVTFAPGDVNQDGVVNGLDIDPFVDTLLNPSAATNPQLCCSDINGDCSVTTADLALFINLLVP
ncbi:MAG TPA: M14 family zinc carboxypeptidase [Phycisphaerae bacterium]|nr:M14 family zinc carboxypeptidase [Phycisphaerae bacterium]